MRSAAVIDLVSEAYVADEIGQQIAVETRRRVFANEFEVSAREYYDAGASGMKPECRYQVRAGEYSGETLLVAGDVEYNIIRVAQKGEWTLLTCERRIGNG